MTLIKSISGFRGTIGGKPGNALTPLDAVKFAAAYGTWIKNRSKKDKLTVVLGRDARPSGEMIQQLVSNTLVGLGIDILDCGLSTTPTVEMMVTMHNADGGIILTASHNPKNWNALKLLNEKGEFVNAQDGAEILALADADQYTFAEVDDLGEVKELDTAIQEHIDVILKMDWVNHDAIAAANFKVAVDAINSTGGISILPLLAQLGVKNVVPLFCEPDGQFAHNPEPLKENLGEIMKTVKDQNCDLGIVVDPDVDRLALICENGEMFGEEYTLVAVADYILNKKQGNTVSNLSSSRALADVTQKYNGSYSASAVGEVNVVEKMKATNAIIGGEGNGGIIFPELHYGRDSLVGVALFLSHLAEKKMKMSDLRASYPSYFMAKKKMQLTPDLDVDALLVAMAEKYKNEKVNTIDGVKIDFAENWVHLRKSNTEPIIRIYTEAKTEKAANDLADRIISEIGKVVS